MSTPSFRSLAFATLLALLVPFGTGCVAEVDADYPPATYSVEGYEPPTYDGYVVYYDDVGRPFYYMNGGVMWVPPASPYYAGYVAHWREYGPTAYHRWYAAHGVEYRNWRGSYRGVYHGGYHGGYYSGRGGGHGRR